MVYCSVVGRLLGPLVYSLCLVRGALVWPVLPSLQQLLQQLDHTNRAVAVVAHITDQEDLMDGKHWC